MTAQQPAPNPPKTRRYNVVLTGSVKPGCDIAQVESALMQLAKIDLVKAKALLNGKPHVVKANVDQNTATQFQSKFEAIGARCAVKPIETLGPGLENTLSRGGTVSKNAPGIVATINTRTIKEAFEGEIAPLAVTTKYRIALAAVAIIMALLPILYVIIVASVAYASLWHTLNDWVWMTQQPYWGYALLYLALIVVGLMASVFLLKPIFAPAERERRPLALSRQEDAIFFVYVEQIAQRAGAPMPAEIQVDCSANVSVRAKHGLIGFSSGQLVLTIGLPILGAMSARELAGVIAHELAHFAQRPGMRNAYIVHSVNRWLSRCVYERDAWDEKIDERIEQFDDYRGGILRLSKGAVWLSRKILFVAMSIGVFASRYMERQMALDADRYEVCIAGSKTFRGTLVRLHEMHAAEEVVHKRIPHALDDKKLTDNYPKMMIEQSKALPERFRESIDANIVAEKPRRLSTQPMDRERIANAEQSKTVGIFTLEVPGPAVLLRYERLCKQASLIHYRTVFGFAIKPEQLVGTVEIKAEVDTRENDEEKLKAYMANLYWPWRYFKIKRPTAFVAPELTETRSMLNDLVGRIRSAIPQYESALHQYQAAYARRIDATGARLLAEKGIVFNASELHVKAATVNDAEEALQSALQEMATVEPALGTVESLLTRRFEMALGTRTDTQSHDETFHLDQALVVLTKTHDTLINLRCYATALTYLLTSDMKVAPESLRQYIKSCADEYAKVLVHLEPATYPFDRKDGVRSIADYVRGLCGNPEQLAEDTQTALPRIDNIWKSLEFLNWRVMARYAALAHDAEEKLGVDSIQQTKNADVKPQTDPDDPQLPF